jgi:hypothetical protein
MENSIGFCTFVTGFTFFFLLASRALAGGSLTVVLPK